ncbi:hypothetical protein GCM10007887_24290 [Methylobacterium haplocladii]|nr:hypothetical protein [Methylobacterium haplocladii]GLS59757.1 hypothetical protein GCM10007887_24290 [Methylobacterium haplocladii]
MSFSSKLPGLAAGRHDVERLLHLLAGDLEVRPDRVRRLGDVVDLGSAGRSRAGDRRQEVEGFLQAAALRDQRLKATGELVDRRGGLLGQLVNAGAEPVDLLARRVRSLADHRQPTIEGGRLPVLVRSLIGADRTCQRTERALAAFHASCRCRDRPRPARHGGFQGFLPPLQLQRLGLGKALAVPLGQGLLADRGRGLVDGGPKCPLVRDEVFDRHAEAGEGAAGISDRAGLTFNGTRGLGHGTLGHTVAGRQLSHRLHVLDLLGSRQGRADAIGLCAGAGETKPGRREPRLRRVDPVERFELALCAAEGLVQPVDVGRDLRALADVAQLLVDAVQDFREPILAADDGFGFNDATGHAVLRLL